jgi:hypothetical protein
MNGAISHSGELLAQVKCLVFSTQCFFPHLTPLQARKAVYKEVFGIPFFLLNLRSRLTEHSTTTDLLIFQSIKSIIMGLENDVKEFEQDATGQGGNGKHRSPLFNSINEHSSINPSSNHSEFSAELPMLIMILH